MSKKPRAKSQFGKVGVLMGGPSSEREVSLRSGTAIYESLLQAGLEVVAIDIATDDRAEVMRLLRAHKLDGAFIALHGRFGEDGQIQSILDELGIRFTGSGVQASCRAMDKVASKRVVEEHGYAVPKYCCIDTRRPARDRKNCFDFALPWVIKPAAHGSSIGMSIIDQSQDLAQALREAGGYDTRIIVEEYIKGRELTVGVLIDRALPVIEIVPKRRFFDFQAKYEQGMTDYLVPAPLEATVSAQAQELALAIHTLLGCAGCSRVDFILTEGGILYFLEINTIPGFTATSLLPKAAKAAGVDFAKLCLTILAAAYEKG